MKLSDLLSRISIPYTLCGSTDPEIFDITFDSRRAGDSVMFFCLVGSASDGHTYAESAYKNGCRIFAAERELSLPEDAVTVIFENTRRALAYVSAAFFDFPARKMQIVGITGTKGKTTVANMLCSCLNSCGIACGYIGTSGIDYAGRHFETKNTTPESLELHRVFAAMASEGVKVCVIEVSSQALFNYRVDGIDFFAGIFTNLSPDHIGPTEHPSFEHYKSCKKRLFSLCRHGIFNADDEYFKDMTDGCTCTVTAYGLSLDRDFGVENISPIKDGTRLGIGFDAMIYGRRTPALLPFPGRFSVLNALAALAACEKLGVDTDKAIIALRKVSVPGRFETVSLFDDRIFIIDYAHNEVSMRTLLETVREYNPERIVTLFGSVGDRTKGRRRDLGVVCNELSDFSIISSDNPGCESPEAIVDEIACYFDSTDKYVKIPDREAAVRYAVRNSRPGDVVLLCGKGHENYQLVGKERVPFSEKEILFDEYRIMKGDKND